MKLGFILTAFLMVFSFKVKADQTSSKTADELPIVQFETKKDLQEDQNSKKKSKKRPTGQVVQSDSSDLQVGLVASKKIKGKTSEKVEEEDFGRLDRELEVLK